MHTSLCAIISNKRRVSALKSLGIVTVEDALTYYPFRVTSPLRIANLKDIKIGEEVAFYAQVQSINVVPMNARRGFRIEINVLQDMQAVAQLIYFSKNRQYAQWLSAKMHVGEMVVVGGTSSAFNGKLQFTIKSARRTANNNHFTNMHLCGKPLSVLTIFRKINKLSYRLHILQNVNFDSKTATSVHRHNVN